MAKVRLKLKRGDQRPFTRSRASKCTIATAAKRTYGGTAIATDKLVVRRGGKTYVMRVGEDGMNVEAAHDAGERVGARTITLHGTPPPTLAEQAAAAKKARAGRQQARTTRQAKRKEAAERAKATAQASAQAPERPGARTRKAERQQPATREQARDTERTRDDKDEREKARVRAAQEAEGRALLARARIARERTAERARVPQQAPAAAQPRATEPATARAPRAIEAPKLRIRNPFAVRPEETREPAKRTAVPAGRR